VRILILQRTNTEQKKLHLLTEKSWQMYARKHNYGYLFLDDDYINERPPTYIIEDSLIKILGNDTYKNWDWIFWADVDSIVMNDSIKLETFINDTSAEIIASKLKLKIIYNISVNSDKILITKHPYEKPVYDWETINTGHLFVKNTDWNLNFLNEVYGYEACYKDVEYARYGGDEIPFTVLYMQNPDVAKHIVFTDINNFLSCNPFFQSDILEHSQNLRNYKIGDFIIHASGIPLQHKINMLKEFLKFKNILTYPTDEISFIDISLVECSPYNTCPGCLAGESCKIGMYNVFTFMDENIWQSIITCLNKIGFNGVCRINAGRHSNEPLCDRILADLAFLGCKVIWDCIDTNHEEFLIRNAELLKSEKIQILVNIIESHSNEIYKKCGKNEFLNNHVLSLQTCVWILDHDSLDSLTDKLYSMMYTVKLNEIYQVCPYPMKPYSSGMDHILCGWEDKQNYLRRLTGLDIHLDKEIKYTYYTDSIYIRNSGELYLGNDDGTNGIVMGNITDLNIIPIKGLSDSRENLCGN